MKVARIGSLIAMAALLGGCDLIAQRQAYLAAQDDARCQSYGAQPGSDAYVNCRSQMHTQRQVARAARSPATCVHSGNVSNCF